MHWKTSKSDSKQKEKEGHGKLSSLHLGDDIVEKKAGFRNEIDIRNLKVSEVQVRLEKYLDDAFLLNISPVYIIHGKGKGILRKAVAQLLPKLKYIKTYRSGETYEGGDGVTVAYFKVAANHYFWFLISSLAHLPMIAVFLFVFSVCIVPSSDSSFSESLSPLIKEISFRRNNRNFISGCPWLWRILGS